MQANRLAELMQGSPRENSATVRNGVVLRLTCLYSASRSRSEGQRFDSLAPPSLFCRKVKAKRGKYCLLLVFETIYTLCGGIELASS